MRRTEGAGQMSQGLEESGRRSRDEGSGRKAMGVVLTPVFDGSTPMPRCSWTMRLGLWLRKLMSLPVSGEIPIRLEGRLSLGPKKSLVLVNCRGKSVLLALGGEAITPVMEVPVPRRRRKDCAQ